MHSTHNQSGLHSRVWLQGAIAIWNTFFLQLQWRRVCTSCASLGWRSWELAAHGETGDHQSRPLFSKCRYIDFRSCVIVLLLLFHLTLPTVIPFLFPTILYAFCSGRRRRSAICFFKIALTRDQRVTLFWSQTFCSLCRVYRIRFLWEMLFMGSQAWLLLQNGILPPQDAQIPELGV